MFGIGALVGLFAFATYSSTGSGSTGVGAVTVWGVLPKEEAQAAFAAAAQIDKSLKDVTYVEHDPATLRGDLAAAIATGNPPDLLLISQEELLSVRPLIDEIPVATLSARTYQTTFVSEASLFQTSTGTYGVPFLVDPLLLFYNRSLLASNGIATAPTTWEALTGLVSKLATVTSSGKLSRALIALGTYDNVHDARGILSALFLQTGVPLSAVGSSGLLTASLGNESTSAGVPPGEAVVRFYTQFADPSKVSYTWDASLPDSQQAFLAGDVGLYLGYASEAPFLKEANPNLVFDVAPLPQPATATGKVTYGLTYAFALVHGAKNASGGYQAAALLSNTAEQQAAAALTGLAPASLAALSAVPQDTTLAVAYSSALYTSGWLSPAPADTDQVFSSMIANVISGRLTIQAALAAARQSLNALLQ